MDPRPARMGAALHVVPAPAEWCHTWHPCAIHGTYLGRSGTEPHTRLAAASLGPILHTVPASAACRLGPRLAGVDAVCGVVPRTDTVYCSLVKASTAHSGKSILASLGSMLHIPS